jgi:hypothetical protein
MSGARTTKHAANAGGKPGRGPAVEGLRDPSPQAELRGRLDRPRFVIGSERSRPRARGASAPDAAARDRNETKRRLRTKVLTAVSELKSPDPRIAERGATATDAGAGLDRHSDTLVFGEESLLGNVRLAPDLDLHCRVGSEKCLSTSPARATTTNHDGRRAALEGRASGRRGPLARQ